jgi:ribonuclease I
MSQLETLSPHGLWPAYFAINSNNRTYPQFCQVSRGKSKDRKGHEWDKHGTCTTLSRDSYFEEENKLTDQTSDLDNLLQSYSGDSVYLEEIYDVFGGEKYVTIKTDQFCRLEEITSCWSKDPSGISFQSD